MRAYFWGNMYLSSIQQGIQAAHALQEMHNKIYNGTQHQYLTEWGVKHKTIILLNGIGSGNLWSVFTELNVPENPYPVAYFQEAKDCLNSSITSVGIVLPEKIYEAARMKRSGEYNMMQSAFEMSTFEWVVVEMLNASSLAR